MVNEIAHASERRTNSGWRMAHGPNSFRGLSPPLRVNFIVVFVEYMDGLVSVSNKSGKNKIVRGMYGKGRL